MKCLDENIVVDFVRGQLKPDVVRAVERHLDGCPDCRKLVAAAAKSSVLAWSSSRMLSHPSGMGPDSTGPITDAAPTDPVLPHIEDRDSGEVPVGVRLGDRFSLRHLLGTGGMGRVYAAYDERLRVQVAVKLLLPELASSQKFLRQLQKEIVVARRVTHPNVCRVYDFGHDGPVHFISMELVEGETLDVRIARAPPSPEVAERILVQIADALEAAHKCGVVHRDLKPSNVMVSEGGHVTVMDFGLARDLSEHSTQQGGVVGTPAYWAPEQGRGEPATPASDVYSFGVVARQVLLPEAGRKPMPEHVSTGLAPRWQAIVERCLLPDASMRFHSGAELRAALVPASIEPRRARPRSVTALIAGSVAAALIALAVIVTTFAPLRLSSRSLATTEPAAPAPNPPGPPLRSSPTALNAGATANAAPIAVPSAATALAQGLGAASSIPLGATPTLSSARSSATPRAPRGVRVGGGPRATSPTAAPPDAGILIPVFD